MDLWDNTDTRNQIGTTGAADLDYRLFLYNN